MYVPAFLQQLCYVLNSVANTCLYHVGVFLRHWTVSVSKRGAHLSYIAALVFVASSSVFVKCQSRSSPRWQNVINLLSVVISTHSCLFQVGKFWWLAQQTVCNTKSISLLVIVQQNTSSVKLLINIAPMFSNCLFIRIWITVKLFSVGVDCCMLDAFISRNIYT